jgi:NAD(P)H dehydrogenase (quinone)
MKTAVLYVSKSGTTRRMAEVIAQGLESVAGMEAGLFPVDAVDPDFLAESGCVIFGTPTYMGTLCAEMKDWLDVSGRKTDLSGKLGGAFATADYLHGGGDVAILAILGHLMVKGMLVYSGGGSWGKPYIHYGPVALKEHAAEVEPVFYAYGQRMAKKTMELFGND